MSAQACGGQAVRTPAGPFWIYRAFNERGDLLYVGKTNNPQRRYEQHRDDKHWLREVKSWPLDLAAEYATDGEVLAAEEAAIRAEKPLMNIQHNENNSNRVDPHTMRYACTGRLYRPELYADVHAGTPASWRPMLVGTVVRPKPERPTRPVRREVRPAARRSGWSARTWQRIGWSVLWLAGFGGSWWPVAALVGESSRQWPWWAWLVGMAAGPTGVGCWLASLSRRRRREVVAGAGLVVVVCVVAVVVFLVLRG